MATRILITHFINPHIFWYFHVDNEQQSDIINAQLYEIEKNMKWRCQNGKSNWKLTRSSCPEVGKKIAVYIITWKRFIRGRVEHISECDDKPTEYIVWAIDYGFPLMSTIDHIHVLPSECCGTINNIKRGGIANLVPVNQQFLLNTMKTVRCQNWHQTACDTLENILIRSHRVFFEEQFNTNGGEHCWGKLTWQTSPSDTPEPASRYLMQQNYAIELSSNFEILCNTFRTIDIKPGFNNSGQNTCMINKLSDLSELNTNMLKLTADADRGEEMEHIVNRKVAEWLNRNNNTLHSEQIDCEEAAANIKSYLGFSTYSENMRKGRATFCNYLEKKAEIRRDIVKDLRMSGEIHLLSEDAFLAINDSVTFDSNDTSIDDTKTNSMPDLCAEINLGMQASKTEIAEKPIIEQPANRGWMESRSSELTENKINVLTPIVKLVPAGFEDHKDEMIDIDVRNLVRTTTFDEKTKRKSRADDSQCVPSETCSGDNSWFDLNWGRFDDDVDDDDNNQSEPEPEVISEILPKNKLHYVPEEAILQTNIIDDLVLAHSRENLQTIKQIENLRLHRNIFEQLVNENIVKVYRMQGYAWSHMLKQHSVFLISGPKTGKTWSYLPHVCNNVFEILQTESVTAITNKSNDSMTSCEDTSFIEKYVFNGPVAIVIVASAQHVDNVAFKCRQLLLRVRHEFAYKTAVVCCYGISNLTSVKVDLLNGCGILIATAASLYRLMVDDTQLINYNRLRHIVIDDMDLIFSRSEQVFTTILKTLLRKTTNKKKITTTQWIVTTNYWNSIMEAMLKMMSQPVLLFGDFLEAAVYGRVAWRIRLCAQDKKMEILRDTLEQHPLHEQRSLVFCNTQEDVEVVVEGLTAAGHKCYVVDDERSRPHDLRGLLKWDTSILPGVVVCMDNAYCDTNIQNVHNIIHYTLPSTWTRFTKRFRCIAKNHPNHVLDNFAEYATKNESIDNMDVRTSALVLIDEENSEQLPRLLNFMRQHMPASKIPADVEAVCRQVMQDREEKRIANSLPLCKYLLEFGNCDEPNCNQRHVFTRYDAIEPSNEIPLSGQLKIHILKVNSPTHLIARLMAHKAVGETVWRDIPSSKEAMLFGIQMNMHYAEQQNMLLFWPLELGKMCIYRGKHSHHRAIVLEKPERKYAEIIHNVPVRVYLIDQGDELSHVESNDLFICAPQFEKFPAQAVNIRLLDIVPYDNERTWDQHSTDMVNKWLELSSTSHEYVHVDISHVLANTIWAKNIIVMEFLSTVKQHIIRVNLAKELLKKHYAMIIQNNAGIGRLIEEFLQTNSTLHATGNDDDKLAIQQQPPAEEEKPKLRTIDDEKELLPVDDNDAIKDIIKSDNTWIELPLNELTPVELDEPNNGNWRNILLQIYSNTEELDKLSQLIMAHITKSNAECSRSPPSTDEMIKIARDLRDGITRHDNYIVHYKSHGYFRAKVVSVHGSNSADTNVRFFLCDYASFLIEKVSKLYDDFLYETTDEIVNFMPYQAIHCRLAGIEINEMADVLKHKVEKECLFAYAVRKRGDKLDWLPSLNINSYDILLYESDEEMLTQTSIMLNKTLVDYNIATPSDETKHYLELNLNLNVSDLRENTELMEEESNENSDECDPGLMDFISKMHEIGLITLTKDTTSETNNVKAIESSRKKVQPKQLEDENEKAICEPMPLPIVYEDKPRLNACYKRPRTTWYETEFLIGISIFAPDVRDYYLEISEKSICFSAIIEGEEHGMVLNLLGTIQVKYAQHAVRGLNVVILLVKSLFVMWPRLLETTDKLAWLSYDVNKINERDNVSLEHQNIYRAITGFDELYKQGPDCNEDSDSEREMFENYTPIKNKEDQYDPTEDI